MAAWIGPAITAGGSILGSILGSKKSDLPAQRAQAQFDQQMDHSVRRRVEDAKRAGVHPLFALGASAGASPTATISGQSDGGSFLGEGIASAAKTVGKAMDPLHQAQITAYQSESEKNFAQAAMFRSEAKRAEGEANSGAVRTFAATEPAAFAGTPIGAEGMRTPIGRITAPKAHALERPEEYFGDVVSDALGLANFLNSVQYNSRRRMKYRNKVRRHKKGGRIPRRTYGNWR